MALHDPLLDDSSVPHTVAVRIDVMMVYLAAEILEFLKDSALPGAFFFHANYDDNTHATSFFFTHIETAMMFKLRFGDM